MKALRRQPVQFSPDAVAVERHFARHLAMESLLRRLVAVEHTDIWEALAEIAAIRIEAKKVVGR